MANPVNANQTAAQFRLELRGFGRYNFSRIGNIRYLCI